MNENTNKDYEMDYSQKSPNSIRSSKSKKEKLTKFLKEYEIEAADLMEVALEIMDEELEEAKVEVEPKPEPKPEKRGRYKDWKTFESKNPNNTLTFDCELEGYPDIDLRRAARVNDLDMLNMAGLLSKEDTEELKTLQQEVEVERSIMESFMRRNFNEKKSHDPRH